MATEEAGCARYLCLIGAFFVSYSKDCILHNVPIKPSSAISFFLPHSTGNDFFLFQNVSSKSASQTVGEGSSSENSTEFIIGIPLEERLACASRMYSAGEFGEIDTIVDKTFDTAFDSFLWNALAPFLGARPAHSREVDVLHLLAMAIHPQPSTALIRRSVKELEEEGSETWSAAQSLMSSVSSHNFHVNYNHRLKLVKLVADHLVLPEYHVNNQKRTSNGLARNDAPLFDGALAHLRASLHSFGMSAMTPYDAHWAQCGVVSIAIQTGMDRIFKEEWDNLLLRIVEDRTKYQCDLPHPVTKESSFSLMNQSCKWFCPHTARGKLLEKFLTRFNESRHYAEESFLQHSLGSLTDAIEWQVDCWTKDTEEEDDGIGKGESSPSADDSPCMLAALLYVARSLFYFLLPILNVDDESGEESEESHHRDMLVSCGIQLVHHWDPTIAHEASMMIILAFCYGPDEMMADYIGAVFESTKMALELAIFRDSEVAPRLYRDSRENSVVAVESLIAAFSQKSTQYADSLLTHLLSEDRQNKYLSSTDAQNVAVFRVIAAVTTASPAAALKHSKTLLKLAQSKDITSEPKQHLIASLLACRRGRFFADGNESVDEFVHKHVTGEGKSNGWHSYLLARHALVTGNFKLAQTMYENVLPLASSESAFLWLSALKSVAEGEATISMHAAKGIPLATTSLRSAESSLVSLSFFAGRSTVDLSAQLKILRLRLDFLDLLTGFRQLTREMRLTGTGPAKNTRPALHLQNSVECFKRLATQYLAVYRQHGLFICQQSRTSLRSLHALCRFVADVARSTFADFLPESSKGVDHINLINALTLPKGDASHPLTVMMQRLDQLALKDMDTSVDPTIRAAAVLELIDCILKTPCPFPRDFMVTRPLPMSFLRLSGDPDSVDLSEDVGESFENEIEVAPNVSFCIFAAGWVSLPVINSAKLPFSMVLVWYTVSFIDEGDDQPQEEKSNDENPGSRAGSVASQGAFSTKPWIKEMKSAPTAASISSQGKYFMSVECPPLLEEGHYLIEARLGCRDIRGGEYELPLRDGPRSISVRVLRSR